MSYRGRGPKNYRRPDERIADDIHQLLTDDPDLDATEIDVTVQDCEVTLSGRVGSRWAKRHAEDVAGRCAGIRDVHNRLTVERDVHLGKASE
jgi:osmotically-inducible protein OsmY